VIAGLEPREAKVDADRQPEQAGARVAEQEPGEGGAFDLDRLAARLLAHLEEDHEEREERDPERDGEHLVQGGRRVDHDPRVVEEEQRERRDGA
jgi:hypothetical protein